MQRIIVQEGHIFVVFLKRNGSTCKKNWTASTVMIQTASKWSAIILNKTKSDSSIYQMALQPSFSFSAFW